MPELSFEQELPEALARAEKLPSLSPVTRGITRLARSEGGLEDLEELLRRAPALESRLLRLANTSAFSSGQDVQSFAQAAVALGAGTVKLLATSLALASDLPAGGGGSFDHELCLRRSITAAAAGRALARLVGNPRGDEAFLCGLLSHVGQIALAECLPELYERVLRESGSTWPTVHREEEVLGFSSPDVAGALLQRWNLPADVTIAVAFMFRPEDLPAEVEGEVRELCRITAIAALAAEFLCGPEKPGPFKRLHHRIEIDFGLSEERIDAFLVGFERSLAETAEVLGGELTGLPDHRCAIEEARLLLGSELRGLDRLDSRSAPNRLAPGEVKLDGLTGLPDRDTFERTLALEIDRRIRGQEGRSLGLVFFDIDRFRSVNATHGSTAGDEILAQIGLILSRRTRKVDLAARYGEDQFALLLIHTSPAQLRTVAERVRVAIEEEAFTFSGQSVQVTASFGGACLRSVHEREDGEALVRVVAGFLAKAKENGRNRCEIFSQDKIPRS
ncbi:MAG: HDOD domain-containing protein [Planctomycetota bacterium]|nr:HDOD domain-containing protein [Planctomycetota bacterium]